MKHARFCKVVTAISCLLLASVGFVSCESCNRRLKNMDADMRGLNRTVTLMDYSGDTIKQWQGKFLINSDDSNGYYFDDDQNNRVMIQGGIIVIEEN